MQAQHVAGGEKLLFAGGDGVAIGLRLLARIFARPHQRFDLLQPRGELVGILQMVVPHLDIVRRELLESREAGNGVVIIVEDSDFHAHSGVMLACLMTRPHFTISSASSAWSASGVPPRTSMPCVASLARTSAISSTAAVSR